MKAWPMIMVLLIFTVHASMESAHQEGQAFGQNLQNQASQNVQSIDKHQVPGFQSANSPQTELDQNGSFSDAINRELNNSDAADALTEISNQRKRYWVDTKNDPIFKHSGGKSAEEILEIKESVQKDGKEARQIVTCEEGGEEIAYQCFQDRRVTRHVPLKTTTLSVNHIPFGQNMVKERVKVRSGRWYRHSRWEDRWTQKGWVSSLPKEIGAFKAKFCTNFNPVDVNTGARFNIDCKRIKNFQINGATSLTEANGYYKIITPGAAISITLYHDTYEGLPGEEIDQWVSGCEAYEKMVEDGLCQYAERFLSQGPETRNIQEYQVYKDAWQYRQKYRCKMIKNECSPLKAKGCHQVGSRCKEMRQNKCWIFEQSYSCPTGNISRPPYSVSSTEPFCLSGNCHNTSYQANGEMLDVISRLNLLKQVQDDIRSQNVNFEIFKGQKRRCSRDCLSFKDCCGGMDGWGVDFNIAGCGGEERELVNLRQKNLCHKIGTYCSKKILGVCVTKKTSFCCFAGKFARILQEQGRGQLGLGWGTAEEPNCRGFTIEELSRINFSNLNMNEVFEELMAKYRSPNIQTLQQKTADRIQQNLQQIEQGVNQKTLPKTGNINENKQNL